MLRSSKPDITSRNPRILSSNEIALEILAPFCTPLLNLSNVVYFTGRDVAVLIRQYLENIQQLLKNNNYWTIQGVYKRMS